MSALLWPGDDRAGDHFSDEAVLAAMVRVEASWLRSLVAAGVAPEAASDDLERLVSRRDVAAVARDAEASGNPVVAMLSVLRERLRARNPRPPGGCTAA